jgi:hypothetical protein
VDLNNIYIEQGNKTPQIDFNHLTGDLILSGRSIPENAAELYEKLLDWVNEYIKNPRLTTNLRLNLEYFNTSSSIWIAKIIKTLTSIKNNEFTLFIHLYLSIDEFSDMGIEDLKDDISPIIDMVGTPAISVGIKIYWTNNKGEIIKESLVLI